MFALRNGLQNGVIGRGRLRLFTTKAYGKSGLLNVVSVLVKVHMS